MFNKNKQPFIIFSVVAIVMMFALSLWAWQQIPANTEIPVHWNIQGEADRYGSKFEGLLLTPLITSGIILLHFVIPYIDPRGANIRRSKKAYNATWVVIVLFFLGMHTINILNILDESFNMLTGIHLLGGAMLVVLGNYLGKIRSNFTFGIRTPWTIASELSWNKTHRLGGKMMMIVGALTIIATLISSNNNLRSTIFFGGLIASVVISTIYSYLVWKGDKKGIEAKS